MSPRRWLPFLLLLLSGCQSPPSPQLNTAATSIVFPKDDLNREIALKSAAKRVIIIGPGAIETVFALGAGNRIVGRDSYADFPPAAKTIAVAGDYQGPSVEKSVALRPDLVIVQGETYDRARVEKWQSQIGAPVAALVATDVRGVQNGIEKLGKWLGKSEKARQIARVIGARPVGEDTRAAPAFIEIERSPLWTAGRKTLVSSVLNYGDFINIADVNGYQAYNVENLLAAQPETYIVPTKTPRAQVVQQLRQSPTLSKLKCIRQGRVVVIDPDLILRPGPRLGLGIAQLRQRSGAVSAAKVGRG